MTRTGSATASSHPAGASRAVTLLGPQEAAVKAALAALLPEVAAAEPGRGQLEAHVREVDGVVLQLMRVTGSPPAEAALLAGLRAADGVLLVLPAVGGPDARTVRAWEQCMAAGVPRAVVVTGFEAPGADFDEAVALCQRLLHDDDLHPLQVPMHGDDDTVSGVLDLLRLQVTDWSGGTPTQRAADPEHHALVEGLRGDLIEALLAESQDESLLDRYLDGEPLEPGTLDAELAAAVSSGRIAPVLALQGRVGADGVRGLLARAFPSPPDVPAPGAERPDGSPVAPLAAAPDGPLAAEVLAPAGQAWLLRVRSGTLRPGSTVRVAGRGRTERDLTVGELSAPDPQRCAAGLLCVATGLDGVAAGDTLSAPEDPLLLQPWPLPDPLHAVALTAAVETDLQAALERLARRDPTTRVERRDTGQLLLWCLDEAHLQAALDDVALPVETSDPVLGTGPVSLEVEVMPPHLRPVLRALARLSAADVEDREHEERDLVTVHAAVPEDALPAVAVALRAASSGTARARRR